MANIQVNFFATSIMRFTTFQLILPNDVPPMMTEGNPHYNRPMKTLFLLHGFSGNCTDWLTGSLISNLAGQYNIAVVMPSGDNSFYLNTSASGNNYEDFICVDLVQYMRNTFGLAKVAEHTFIGGLSMGGFGALHSGLAHPEVFGKMFAFSSALICDDLISMRPGTDNGIANYDYYVNIFGKLSELGSSRNNPKVLVKERIEKGETIQPIYMACGSDDFLIRNNHDFRDFLTQNNVNVTYMESPGIHDWKFWNEYLEPAIAWAVEK